MSFRFAIRVKPGASRTRVGGRHGDALIVAVSAPAVDGRANEAVRSALADAFPVRRSAITIVRGHRARDKLIELDPAPPDADVMLAALLDG
jgi:uncharacterized protein (TIGR00251 family)